MTLTRSRSSALSPDSTPTRSTWKWATSAYLVRQDLVLSDAVEPADDRGFAAARSARRRANQPQGRHGTCSCRPRGPQCTAADRHQLRQLRRARLDVPNGFAVVERGFQNYKPLQGEDEVILVGLSRGETVTAKRSDKKFIWFGKSSVAETLTYSLDPDLHCTRKQASEPGTERVF